MNPDQIRTVIRAFKQAVEQEIYPERTELPKTLIFAKSDSHADDIIQIVREEFNEGNDFCKKVTYKSADDPDTVLANFRNAYNPRVAVTVDMIATGTDVKPLGAAALHARCEEPQLLRADEGPRHPHLRCRQPAEGDAQRRHQQDPLRDRGCRGREQEPEDEHPAAGSARRACC
ncbi:MAG: hypothetical protein LKM36_11960 [Flavobacteriales bacterium]|nr:hypothetical protein [Flavobacteriales bacterium]